MHSHVECLCCRSALLWSYPRQIRISGVRPRCGEANLRSASRPPFVQNGWEHQDQIAPHYKWIISSTWELWLLHTLLKTAMLSSINDFPALNGLRSPVLADKISHLADSRDVRTILGTIMGVFLLVCCGLYLESTINFNAVSPASHHTPTHKSISEGSRSWDRKMDWYCIHLSLF